MSKIDCSESFWTTLVGKDWKKCKLNKIGHSKSFFISLVGKSAEQLKLSVYIIYFISLWYKKIGKGVK